MTIPPPPTARLNHGHKVWTTEYRVNGRKSTKRFGRAGEVSRREAHARYDHWLEHEYKPAARAKPGTVADLCAAYLAEVVAKRYTHDGTQTTSVARHRIVLESLCARMGDLIADRVTPADVHGWLTGFITEVRKPTSTRRVYKVREARKDPRSKGWVNLALAYVKRMYRWAATAGRVGAQTAGGVLLVESVRADSPDVRQLEPVGSVAYEAVEKTAAKIDPALADLLWFMWWTGCRPSEACRVSWAQVACPPGSAWIYTPAKHKTKWRGKGRAVAIGPKAQAILEKYRHTMPGVPLFRAKGGMVMTDKRLRNRVLAAAREAGLGQWSPNQIRHAYATRVKLSHGAEAVQAVLGHASVSMQETYLDRTTTLAAKIAAEVG